MKEGRILMRELLLHVTSADTPSLIAQACLLLWLTLLAHYKLLQRKTLGVVVVSWLRVVVMALSCCTVSFLFYRIRVSFRETIDNPAILVLFYTFVCFSLGLERWLLIVTTKLLDSAGKTFRTDLRPKDEQFGRTMTREVSLMLGLRLTVIGLAINCFLNTPGSLTTGLEVVTLVGLAIASCWPSDAWLDFFHRSRRRRRVARLAKVPSREFTEPNGEPCWALVPEGTFTMGPGMKAIEREHEVFVEEFALAIVPVTNNEYVHYVREMDVIPPEYWSSEGPFDEKFGRLPVTDVSWHDAVGYCNWLTHRLGKVVRLPTEAEWEKAARGTDKRLFPWGDEFRAEWCNTAETGIGSLTPVGIFTEGASPYGCLDMAGNMAEFTSSLWGSDPLKANFGYPYDPHDGRELSPVDSMYVVVRGGSYGWGGDLAKCATRLTAGLDSGYPDIGFRVVWDISKTRESRSHSQQEASARS